MSSRKSVCDSNTHRSTKLSIPNGNIKGRLRSTDIAVIGMACRFPGAENYQTFWENLVKGVNSVREIPPDRWDSEQYYSADITAPNKSVCKWGGLLTQIDRFDNRFFSISPREAQNMDPQQRLLLEETWHCLEDANVPLLELQVNTTSVFVGVMTSDYQQVMFRQDIPTDSYACLGNYECILANRISYFLDLKGESKSINTACSSSLVAINEARRSLLLGECEYAIAAGVNVICHPWKYISFSKSRMLSPDGQCKTFDEQANGYVPGEGVGVLLLHPLELAMEKGHAIRGILKGSAVNHGGKTLSITAPRVEAQRDVVLAALASGDIDPLTVSYIETHGTGTSLGDPIEVEGLTQALGRLKTGEKPYCKIGSVKTNIGHLEAAAGIAGVIKVLLMLRYQKIPQLLNFKKINPMISLQGSPFEIADSLSEWNQSGPSQPRRAGVSSFGFGGVNAHVILEEHEPLFEQSRPEPGGKDKRVYPFILSAKTKESLQGLLKSWQSHLKSDRLKSSTLESISSNLLRKKSFQYRFGAMLRTKDELKELIEDTLSNERKLADRISTCQPASLILRVGQAPSISPETFKIAYQKVKELVSPFDTICDRMRTIANDETAARWIENPAGLTEIDQRHFQFVVLYSAIGALSQYGVRPTLIEGEGIGQIVSAAVSGLLDLDDALQMILSSNLKNIDIKRPHLPVYDPFFRRVFSPYELDIAYPKTLIEAIKIDEIVYQTTIDKAKRVRACQRTFKKHLEEWDNLLHQFGATADTVLTSSSSELFAGKNQRAQQILILTIVTVSLKKLSSKWDLMETVHIEDPAFRELIDLILDGVWSLQDVFSIIVNPSESSFKKCAENLFANQKKIGREKPYSFLNQSNKIINEINKQNEWRTGWGQKLLLQHGEAYRFGKKDMILEIGQFAEPTKGAFSLDVDCIGEALSPLLLRLWIGGCSINWYRYSELFDSHYHTPLPGYVFDPTRFWIHKKDVLKQSEYPIHGGDVTKAYEKRMPSKLILKNPNNGQFNIRESKASTSIEVKDRFTKGKGETLNKDFSAIISGDTPEEPASKRLINEKGLSFGEIGREGLRKAVEVRIKKILKDVLYLKNTNISSATRFTDLGVDSVLAVEIIHTINQQFKLDLRTTLLYEYTSLEPLVQHLADCHGKQIHAVLTDVPTKVLTNKKSGKQFLRDHESEENVDTRKAEPKRFSHFPPVDGTKDIAVIGLSGRFPGAENVAEFWRNLEAGKYSIKEIPSDRWPGKSYYDPRVGATTNRSYGKWGGFIDDIDKFDPLFFKISPAEAEQMDPQQRLFLETVWTTMEDAGYGCCSQRPNSDIGLFVGVMWNEYSLLCDQEGFRKDGFVGPGSLYWSIANRVSHFMDFIGPSIAVDSACSSSLVAVHLAIQSIFSGECQMAVAGGINLSLHPSKYVYLSQIRFLSTEDRSTSFAAGGDGYIPGEGFGAVLLKPLDQAMDDRDTIYGVIKGSAVNHGGGSAAYMVPNPNAQAKALNQALDKARISPWSVSYMEASANGTAVTDEIEMASLNKVFQPNETREAWCAIGSVKSNIGHLEAASGISQLIKVLLQLRYQTLVPTLILDSPNPNLRLEGSSFYLQTTLGEWKRPEIKMNGESTVFPRRAIVSSYGAGGTNAQLVLEESPPVSISSDDDDELVLLTFSAKTKERLTEYIRKFKEFFDSTDFTDWRNAAFTLQIGRELMEERVAMLGRNRQEFVDLFDAFLNRTDNEVIPGLFEGAASNEHNELYDLVKNNLGQQFIQFLSTSGEWSKIAALWVQGVEINWEQLYGGNRRCRVPLPTYPFAKRHCRIPGTDHGMASNRIAIPSFEDHSSLNESKQRADTHAESLILNQEEKTMPRIRDYFKEKIGALLGLHASEIEPSRFLVDYGLDSIKITKLKYSIEKDCAVEIPMAVLGESRNIDELARKIDERMELSKLKDSLLLEYQHHKSRARERLGEFNREIRLTTGDFWEKKNDLTSVVGEQLDKLYEELEPYHSILE